MKLFKLALPLLLITSPVFSANITVMYNSGNPVSVPTLSSSMLFILSALLVLVAFRIKKQNNSGTAMIIGTLSIIALLSSAGGIKLISDATAGGPSVTPILTGGSGSISVNGMTTNQQLGFINPNNIYGTFFSNDTTNDITITGITSSDASCTLISNDYGSFHTYPHCSIGTLAVGNGCYIACSSSIAAVSDIRLKQNIKYLTKLDNGLKIYSFEYIEKNSLDKTEYVGVMAQDLLKDIRYKDAVVVMDNGFYAVNYNALGLKMISLEKWNASQQNILIDGNQISHNSVSLKKSPTLWKQFQSK